MNESVFNLTPETMQKVKEAQFDVWKFHEGVNGEDPPPQLTDSEPWRHRQLERVQIDKVEVQTEERNGQQVTVIPIQVRCLEGINQNRVHTQWVRLYPPYEDSGNFSRNTMENMALLGQLLDAVGFDPSAKQNALLPSLREIPEKAEVVVTLAMFCKTNRRTGELFVGQDVVEFHTAA